MKLLQRIPLILATLALSLTIPACGGGGGGSSSSGGGSGGGSGAMLMMDGFNTAKLSVNTACVGFTILCERGDSTSGTIAPYSASNQLRFSPDSTSLKHEINILGGTWKQTNLNPTSIRLSLVLETGMGTVTIPDMVISLEMAYEEENKNLASYQYPTHRGDVAQGTATLELSPNTSMGSGNERTYTATMTGNSELVVITYSR